MDGELPKVVSVALELPSEDGEPEVPQVAELPRGSRRSVSERARESLLEVLRRTTRIVKKSKKAEDPLVIQDDIISYHIISY